MKICVAQTKPVKGGIQQNIDHHKAIIKLAVMHGADMIVFPELSLTGYEPTLARQLAMTADDGRILDFQNISDKEHITIGVGLPLKGATGTLISLVLFQPDRPRITYSKQYLHPDEKAFFVAGEKFDGLEVNGISIALAICYELSVPAHAAQAFKNRPGIYVASVAKSLAGVEQAAERLSELAQHHQCIVLMANCVGYCDNFHSAGRSSVWNSKGTLLRQLNGSDEGLLIVDPESHQVVIEKYEGANTSKRQP